MGNWAALIPQVEIDRDINHGTLGNILFAAAFGAIVSVPAVSWCNKVLGSGRSCLLGSLFMAIVFPIIGVRSTTSVFVLGVFLLGFGLLFLDASMNSQAVLLEKVVEKPIVGYFHAIYAVGALVGAMVGGVFMENNITILEEFIIIGVVVLIPDCYFSTLIYSFHEEQIIIGENDSNADEKEHPSLSRNTSTETVPISEIDDEEINTSSLHLMMDKVKEEGQGEQEEGVEMLTFRHRHHTTKTQDISYSPLQTMDDDDNDDDTLHHENLNEPSTATTIAITATNTTSVRDVTTLAIVSLLCFVAYFGEGSIGDWSGIYLTYYWSCSPFYATLGYVSCQLCIAMGRYGSDHIVLRVGRKRLLIMAGIVAAFGLFLAVVASFFPATNISLFLAISGFAICGVGLSVVSPTVISMAGNISGYTASDAVAYASAIGYLGVLLGPPFLGNLAKWLGSLHWSFLVDSGLLVLIALLALTFPSSPSSSQSLSSSSSKSLPHTVVVHS